MGLYRARLLACSTRPTEVTRPGYPARPRPGALRCRRARRLRRDDQLPGRTAATGFFRRRPGVAAKRIAGKEFNSLNLPVPPIRPNCSVTQPKTKARFTFFPSASRAARSNRMPASIFLACKFHQSVAVIRPPECFSSR